MDRFENRRRFRTVMNSKLTLVILLLVLMVVLKSTWILYGKNKEAGMKKESLSRESKQIGEREDFLEGEISRLRTEQGVEEILRQKFNIKKDGEEVLVIIDEEIDEKERENKSLKTRFGYILIQLKDFFR
ncbi:MAG: hypothetical protein AAB513_00465 [Patescibacteria group bacterium]